MRDDFGPESDIDLLVIGEAGFGEVTARPMSGGIVCLHSGWKL